MANAGRLQQAAYRELAARPQWRQAALDRSEAYVRAITVHAEQMRADPRTYRGYWHWQVYYRTVDGDRLLPVGYDGTA